MRVCSKCGIAKPKEDYYKENRVADGCKSDCKECHKKHLKKPTREEANARAKNWRDHNPDKVKAITKKSYENKKSKNPNIFKELYDKNKEVLKEKAKQRRREGKVNPESMEKKRIYSKKQREKSEVREQQRLYKQKWQKENKERLNKKSKEYSLDPENSRRRKEYLQDYKERRREISKQRRESDPLHRFKELLRSGVYRAFQSKGWGKTGKSFEILGCDFKTAKAHIERQFTEGMSWEKIGSEIHIDHKIPIHSAKNVEEVKHLCHYRNLQPLWKLDNLKKNNKILPTQIHLPL